MVLGGEDRVTGGDGVDGDKVLYKLMMLLEMMVVHVVAVVVIMIVIFYQSRWRWCGDCGDGDDSIGLVMGRVKGGCHFDVQYFKLLDLIRVVGCGGDRQW